MPDFSLNEMLDMQKRLQDKYKDKWEQISPETGKHKIQNILRDGSLSDPECFRQIEEVVRCFETLGSDGGGRHDFG